MKFPRIETARSVHFAICGGVLFALAPCWLIGCGWSPTTLALESATTSERSPLEFASASTTTLVTSAPAIPETEASDATATSNAESNAVDVPASRLVGTWQDSFFGKRTLVLNADGSATMVLDLDLAGQLLYGRHLEFDLKWSVEGARVTIDILGGRPAKSAQSAMSIWGSRYEYLLDCVEDHQIEMRLSDGSMNHTLRRISDGNTAPPR